MKKDNRHKLITLFLLFFTIGQASGQDTLSLQEAIELSLNNSFGIKTAKNNQRITENNFSLGNAGILPRIDAFAAQNYSIDDSRQEYLGERGVQERTGAKSESFSGSVELQWTLFDGLRMFIAYDRLAELNKMGETNLQMQVENAVNDINIAYHQIVLEQERLKVINNILDLSGERMEIAKTKYEVGKASKMEYLAAQVDYNEDTSSYVLQLERLNDAKIDLNVVIGLDRDTKYQVQSSIHFVETLDREDLYQSMLAGNSARKLQALEYSVARLEAREIKGESLPVFSFNTSYNYNKSAAETGLVLSRRTNGLGVGFTAAMNIFNGFNLNRRIQNARINIENSELAMQQLDLALKSQLEKSYNNYHNSIIVHRLEQSNVNVARENAEIALERYKLGVTNAIELREAQLNLAQAENRLLDAAYSVKLNEINLMQLSGMLSKN